MYLSKLTLNYSRRAILWAAQPYRVHQRLRMACPDDPRLLFRLDQAGDEVFILTQTRQAPDWDAAFGEFPVLAETPLCKSLDWKPQADQMLAFRLRANPTMRIMHDKQGQRIKKGKRIGLGKEQEQRAWLTRKGEQGGFGVLRCQVRQLGLIRVARRAPKSRIQLLAVQFDGLLQVRDPQLMAATLASGIGSAKGMGFGLLSVAPTR